MRRIHVAAVCALAILLVASAASASGIRRVGPKANGTSITIPLQTTLVVALPGNPTTGYSWRVRTVTRTVLKPLSVRYLPKKPLPGHLGSGGTYYLRFRAVRAGKTPLRLAYVRADPTNAVPAKTFSLGVRVSAAS
jgi:inhibitor of cysteine peptidase